jgi:hypothetical protein
VKPNSIEVPKGTLLKVNVVNKGQIDHDFKLDGKVGTKMLKPGESESVTLERSIRRRSRPTKSSSSWVSANEPPASLPGARRVRGRTISRLR